MIEKIFITCPKCHRHQSGERRNEDPKEATGIVLLCGACSGGDFAELSYFDKNGKHITRDYTV